MYANVIAGVDGRQGGRDAAALAGLLASPGSVVSLVYVAAPTTNHAPDLQLESADEGRLRELLALEVNLSGGEAEIRRVPAVSVGAGLQETAASCAADLIVVGSCHRRGLRRLFSGDDVRSVLHQTPHAVAVAPTEYARHYHRLQRIGVAFDASPQSEVALAQGGLLAQQHGATLSVRHVVEPSYYPGSWAAASTPPPDPESDLAAARARENLVDGLQIEHLYGPLRESTKQLTQGLDLLVCGSRRYGTVRRLAVGSTSERLARHAQVPLLIAPVTDHAVVERWRERGVAPVTS